MIWHSFVFQLSQFPVNKRPVYDAIQGANVAPTTFYNMGDLEIQDNIARLWYAAKFKWFFLKLDQIEGTLCSAFFMSDWIWKSGLDGVKRNGFSLYSTETLANLKPVYLAVHVTCDLCKVETSIYPGLVKFWWNTLRERHIMHRADILEDLDGN